MVVSLRGGDDVIMHGLYLHRAQAFQYMEAAFDSSTTWWKVVPVESNELQYNLESEIVLRVRWGTSNRATVMGVYQPGMVPAGFVRNDTYTVQRLVCR